MSDFKAQDSHGVEGLCNLYWDSFAPNTMVYHVHKIKSDHWPLAVSFGLRRIAKPP